MQVQVYSGHLTQLVSQVLVVFCFEDIRPLRGLAAEVDWIYGGALSQILMQGRFSGRSEEALLFATEGKLKVPKIVLLGQGKSRDVKHEHEQIHSMSTAFRQIIAGLNVSECALEMHPASTQKLDTLERLEYFLEGWPAPGNEATPLELKLLVEDREKASVLQKVRNWVPRWQQGATKAREEGLQIAHGAL